MLFVLIFAPGPALVKRGVCKVTVATARLSDLEMLRGAFVLMASGAIDLLPLDFIFH
jgi:hypothetical protein